MCYTCKCCKFSTFPSVYVLVSLCFTFESSFPGKESGPLDQPQLFVGCSVIENPRKLRLDNEDSFIFFIWHDLVMVSCQKRLASVLIPLIVI